MILGTKTSLGKGIVTILICKKLIILYFVCFIKINLHIFAKIKTKSYERIRKFKRTEFITH